MTSLGALGEDDMTLTPEQIRARTFSAAERGYDRGEVDSFLAQVAADYQAASAAIDVTSGARMDPADSATESAAAALERGLDELERAVAEVARTGARALALAEEANRRMAKAQALEKKTKALLVRCHEEFVRWRDEIGRAVTTNAKRTDLESADDGGGLPPSEWIALDPHGGSVRAAGRAGDVQAGGGAPTSV
jgi:DivIVA domain-containing protein